MPDPAVAELLWLPSDARLRKDVMQPVVIRNGRSIYVDGSAAVYFDVATACDELARTVSARFTDSVWRRRTSGLYNPQQALPLGDDCLRSMGDTRGWRAEWENRRGDIITYAFGGEANQLHGEAAYLPGAVSKEVRRRISASVRDIRR